MHLTQSSIIHQTVSEIYRNIPFCYELAEWDIFIFVINLFQRQSSDDLEDNRIGWIQIHLQ